ncbi:hypothetical protein HYDPIDRAFT_131387 [Hydnomerulius pinastri MD-312]|uniref:Uncharacterized protein n=1 Tax=Hydnomerulius pinastri MD-312 TaxID=994086 RepID=A0A0C9WAT0_9AGAM|nr:hypothetical protein HYDPIDRAFT_131387 [Hydnomerulius pinastri MD-312]
MYLYLRYISLIVHGVYELSISHLTSGYASESTCKVSFILSITIIQLSTTVVEVILAMRAYALFNKSRRIGLLLCFLITAEFANMCFTMTDMAPVTSFGTVCVLLQLPQKAATTGMIVPITQTTLVGLITFKSILAVQSGWGRTPLVSLLIQEGIAVYLTMLVLFAFVFFGSMREDERMISMVFWSMSIVSTCGCRLLINMERVGKKYQRRTPPQFTTQIEIYG